MREVVWRTWISVTMCGVCVYGGCASSTAPSTDECESKRQNMCRDVLDCAGTARMRSSGGSQIAPLQSVHWTKDPESKWFRAVAILANAAYFGGAMFIVVHGVEIRTRSGAPWISSEIRCSLSVDGAPAVPCSSSFAEDKKLGPQVPGASGGSDRCWNERIRFEFATLPLGDSTESDGPLVLVRLGGDPHFHDLGWFPLALAPIPAIQ